MDLNQSYRVNRPAVVDETMEGETVIINLDTGNYFSLNGSATLLWNHLTNGANLQVLVDSSKIESLDGPSAKQQGLVRFFALLADESLIVVNQEESTAAISELLLTELPAVQKFDDMQQLLLLDPVHEVDEKGWPSMVPNDITT